MLEGSPCLLDGLWCAHRRTDQHVAESHQPEQLRLQRRRTLPPGYEPARKGAVLATKAVDTARQRQCLSREGSGHSEAKAVS